MTDFAESHHDAEMFGRTVAAAADVNGIAQFERYVAQACHCRRAFGHPNGVAPQLFLGTYVPVGAVGVAPLHKYLFVEIHGISKRKHFF